MKNWKQLLAGFSTMALLLTNVGVTTPLSVYAEETVPELSQQTLTSGDVTVEGDFPEGAQLKATSAKPTIDGQELIAAYDLSVTYTVIEKDENVDDVIDEETNEPKEETETYTLEDGATVTVTVGGLNNDDVVNIYQGGSEVKADVTVADNEVSFKTSSLETVAVSRGREITKAPGNSTLDIATIEVTNNIDQDGTLVATFKDSQGGDITDDVVAAAKAGTLTIEWKGGNNKSGAVSSDTPNKINVAKDNGAQKTYTAVVGDKTSNEVKVDYYDEVQNGGFETPVIGSSWTAIVQSSVPGWSTTATDQKIEIGRYAANAHGIQGDYYDQSTVGNQYSELNAFEIATLYQDVLTDAGSDLNWSLLHHALSSQGNDVTEKIYVVIMSKTDAEKLLAGNSATIVNTVAEDLDYSATKATYTIPSGDYAGTQVKVTLWTLETESMYTTVDGKKVFSCKSLQGGGTSSDTTGWSYYTGSYKVPDGQYVTRMFFASGSGKAANGNLLDEVYFDQKISYTIEYWVYNAATGLYDLKSSDTKTGRQYPNDNVKADTSAYSSGYEFVGNTLGRTSGGKNPTLTTKNTSFDVNNDQRVLSLYYRETAGGTITWNDNDAPEGTRPTDPGDVTITTVVNGKTYVADVSVDDEGNWTYEFKDLPKYDEETGDLAEYTINTAVSGYTTSVDKETGKITYTYDPNVSGSIKWSDGDGKDRPSKDDVKITTVVDGKTYTATVTVDDNGNWSYEFEDLPRDKDGKPIEYTITTTVDGYTTTVANDGTVTYTKTAAVAGGFTWNDNDDKYGIRPDTVEVQLLDKDGNPVKGEDGKAITTVARPDQNGNYTYSFDNVPAYDANGNEIEYTVSAIVPGYDIQVKANGDGGYDFVCTFTNTYTSDKPGAGKSSNGEKHDGGGYAKVDFYLVDDATTQSLTGGIYGLYTSAGELVGTYTTDANGHIQFPNLKGGTYYLLELTSPDGYALNGNRLYFTVDGTPIAVMDTNKALAANTGAAVDTNANAAGVNGVNGVNADQSAAAVTGAGTGNGAAVGGTTGDNSLMMVYAAAAAVAAIVLAAWAIQNRRKANR